jgi:membrane protein implicated in regulation of membrane protease activity
MEFLIANTLWWHWIILGIILVVAEIVVPLFIIIWFGLSAIVIGFVALLFTTSFLGELALWILLSILFLFIWFKFFKEASVSESGQSDFRLETKGVVIERIPHAERGKVRFEVPVLGSSQWHAISDEVLEVGDTVHIVDVNGQLIKVKKDH